MHHFRQKPVSAAVPAGNGFAQTTGGCSAKTYPATSVEGVRHSPTSAEDAKLVGWSPAAITQTPSLVLTQATTPVVAAAAFPGSPGEFVRGLRCLDLLSGRFGGVPRRAEQWLRRLLRNRWATGDSLRVRGHADVRQHRWRRLQRRRTERVRRLWSVSTDTGLELRRLL